jgi:hypothetical protein
MAVFGVGTELAAFERMERRVGMTAEPYSQGRGGGYVRAGKILSGIGLVGALLGRRNRVLSGVSGAALMAASAATRWGIFHAGMQSATDPKYTIVRSANGCGQQLLSPVRRQADRWHPH